MLELYDSEVFASIFTWPCNDNHCRLYISNIIAQNKQADWSCQLSDLDEHVGNRLVLVTVRNNEV